MIRNSYIFLKLSGVLEFLTLASKLLVNIKAQIFYSCLTLTENFLGNIKTQIVCHVFILTENLGSLTII